MTDTIIAEIPCNICGSRDVQLLERLSTVLNVTSPGRVVQCHRCGLIYLSPRPAEEAIEDIYANEDYYERSPLVAGDETVPPHIQARLIDLEQRLGRKGHMLDVGCAKGTFVAYAREQAWDAEGIDVSPWATKIAREQRGLPVRTGTLEEQQYPDQSFDVVHSSHTLEHVPDPVGVLREIRRILRPYGFLSLEVPQEIERIFDAVRDVLHLRQSLPYINSHLYFFTHRTLRQVVQKAGFQVVQVKTRNPEIESKSKYPFGTPVTRSLFWLDNVLIRGANLELIASPLSPEELHPQKAAPSVLGQSSAHDSSFTDGR